MDLKGLAAKKKRMVRMKSLSPMILKKLSDRHGYPQDLVNMPGVPTLALFMGEYAPKLINGARAQSDQETRLGFVLPARVSRK